MHKPTITCSHCGKRITHTDEQYDFAEEHGMCLQCDHVLGEQHD